jgi:hypothetical protein
MARLSVLVALLAVVAFVVAFPGGKHEYKGKPTTEMVKAMELVVKELKTRYNEDFSIAEVVKIESQVVAGMNYFFHLKVKGSKTGDYQFNSVVNHRIHGPMSIVSIHEISHSGGKHEHEGDLTEDMKKALDVAIKFLSEKHKETMKLVKVKEVHTQVVASINYHFVIDVEGDHHDLHEVTIVVHHHFDDSMSVIVVKDVHIDALKAANAVDTVTIKRQYDEVLQIAQHLFSFIRGVTAVGEGDVVAAEKTITVEVDDEYVKGTIPDTYLGYVVSFTNYPGTA